jgi:hypothetical protein
MSTPSQQHRKKLGQVLLISAPAGPIISVFWLPDPAGDRRGAIQWIAAGKADRPGNGLLVSDFQLVPHAVAWFVITDIATGS